MIKANLYSSLADVFTSLSDKQTFPLPERYGSSSSDHRYEKGRQATSAISHAWASAFEIAALQGKLDVFEKQLEESTYFCPWPLALLERVDLNKFFRLSYDYEWEQYFNTFFRLAKLHSSKGLVLKFSSQSSSQDEGDKLEEESDRQSEMGCAISQDLIYEVFVRNRLDGDSLHLHANITSMFIKEYLKNLLPHDVKHFGNVVTATIEKLGKVDKERTEIIRTNLLPLAHATKSTE